MGHARHSRDAAGWRDRGTVDLVSMVGDDDVQLYLLAMKTLYRRLRRGNVVAIVAETMPQTQRDLLAEHF